MIRLSKSDLDCNELLFFFPSYGRKLPGGKTWLIKVSGAIYEPGEVSLRKRLLVRLLCRVMKAAPEQVESELFQQRIQAFVAETEKGKRIRIGVGNRQITLQKKSKKNGHFSGTFVVTQQEVDQLRDEGQVVGDQLEFRVLTSRGDDRSIVGRAHLVDPDGLSVISDIDDTIKHTQVTSRRELLANTFLREFRSIEGMAGLYCDWAQSGATFHYVSSSPWQLYQPLADLCDTSGFPGGTFHLRSYRLRDHMLRRVKLVRRQGKIAEIRSLIKTFPTRKFVLIGDSGERDPEIYCRISKQFPSQVLGIFIRELDVKPLESERITKLNEQGGAGRFKTFTDPAELGDLFRELKSSFGLTE